MSANPTLFRIEGEYLIGPNGRWRISDIKAAYKKEGGRFSAQKWLATATGMGVGLAAMALNPAGGAVLAAGAFGYYFHRTMRVFALIDGHEAELHAEVYLCALWREEEANQICDDLIRLIETAQKPQKA